ncbi:type II CAAX prenyl endopeptidase Rce1 family protein [Lysobacter korlensis]|uniref:Type II CAAX prenyl endopeptidase Rce1 family protein n=1 Tax=Lysobacter korlensis TaxID=553636 RepID=A0ABV6RRH4_9GAMM
MENTRAGEPLESALLGASPGRRGSSTSLESKYDRRITSFLGLTFGFTWLVVGAGYLLGVTSIRSPGYIALAALCMLCPALAAVIQQLVLDRESWSGLGISLKATRWSIVFWTAAVGTAIVPLYLLVTHLLAAALGFEGFGQVSVTSEQVSSALASGGERAAVLRALLENIPGWAVLVGALLVALVAAVTVNLPFMLGEELGWRGYLWQRTAHWNGYSRVLFTGTAWGLWHAPLVAMGHNYPGYPAAGIGMMVILCILLAFLFDWTRSRSRSIWSSCVLHGLINGTVGLAVVFAPGSHALFGVTGAGGFAALGLMVVAIVAFDRPYRAQLTGKARSAFPTSIPAQLVS